MNEKGGRVGDISREGSLELRAAFDTTLEEDGEPVRAWYSEVSLLGKPLQ